MSFRVLCPFCKKPDNISQKGSDRVRCRPCAASNLKERTCFRSLGYVNIGRPSCNEVLDHLELDFIGDSFRWTGKCSMCDNKAVYFPRLCDSHLQALYHLRVAPSTIKGSGLGVFATSDIKKGSFVCDYDGQEVDRESIPFDYPTNYSVLVSDRLVVDAFNFRSVASMINDCTVVGSRSVCGDLSEMDINVKFIVSGSKVRVKAIEDICDGDELFVEYGCSDFTIQRKRYKKGNERSFTKKRKR